MSTSDKLVNIYLKKFLPQEQMNDNFLLFLLKQQKDNLALMYPGQGFFFGNTITGTGPDEFTLTTPSLATDGLANLLKLDPANAVTNFENALGIPYSVGLRYNVIESDVEVNVRTGQFEYVFSQDAIGEKGEPDAVVDNGSTITLDVDGVTEVGVSNAGRKVVVYLKRAVGLSDTFYNGVVEFVGGKNVINTTHLLGQTAGLVLVDPSDYVVFILGATVRRNTDLSLDPNIAYLGIVTGVGAGNTPTAGDINTSVSTTLFTGAALTPTIDSLRAFVAGGGEITWDLDTGTVTWAGDLKFFLASRPFNFTIQSSSQIGLADGECLYFLRDEIGGIKTFTKASITAVPHDPLYEVIIFRHGDDILFRNGVLELEGETGDTTVGRIDGITKDLLNFMGAKNESDGNPKYSEALGGSLSNQFGIDNESLLKTIKRLDLRNDIINKVKAIDFNATGLPATAAVTIDGQVLANGDKILFANIALNGIYKVAGIGVAATWIKQDAFNGLQAPEALSLVGVQLGSEEFVRTVYQYTSTNGWRPMDSSELSTEPTGLQDRDKVDFSFVEGTRTVTVEPKAPATAFFYAENGKLFKVESAKNLVIPDLQGLHFIHFDGETLASTQAFAIDTILRKTWVAAIYWDQPSQVATFLGDARHMLVMDATTHAFLRFTLGSQYSSGFGLSDTAGDGSADAHAQIGLDGGTIYNQDVVIDVTHQAVPAEFFEQILNGTAEIPVYKRDLANGSWVKEAATTFPLKAGAARPQFNNFTGAIWETKDATADGKHIAMYLLAGYDVREPIIAVMGQREDDNLNDAQSNNTLNSLSIGDLPTLENKAIYRLIFETDSTYANSIKGRLVDITDLRTSDSSATGGFTPTVHNSLSGRSNSGAHPSQAISTTVSDFGGAADELDDNAKKVMKALDDHFKALRIKVHPSNPNRIVITGATVTLSNGIKLEQQLKNLIISHPEIQVDFSTGEVFESDGSTPFNGGNNDFPPIVPPAGQNRWASITMVASTVNADNTINLQPVILLSESDNFRAAFSPGTKLGQIRLEEDAGSIADIVKGNITRQGVGGSGDGGAGDANSFLEDLKARARRGLLKFVTPNIFSQQGEDETDLGNTTATFDIANSVYKFDTAEKLTTINQLGSRFLGTSTPLTEEADGDIAQAELHLEYVLGAVDLAPIVKVSRDGGNEFQTMAMTRVGISGKYRGLHTFAEEAANQNIAELAVADADTERELTDTGADASLALKVVITEKMAHKVFSLYLDKLGAPLGTGLLKVVKDDGGLPSTDVADIIFTGELFDIPSLSAGQQTLALDVGRIITKPGSYWFILETDQEYKDNFTTAVDSLRWRSDTAGTDPDSATQNGATGVWTTLASEAFVYLSEGMKYDLRIEIESSADDIELSAMGSFYGHKGASLVPGLLLRHTVSINGDDNVTTIPIPAGKFLPNPELLFAIVVETNQLFVYPAIDIQGQDIKFKSGDLLVPGENLTIVFDQSRGGAFDNSDLNRNLMAANHLGNATGFNDLSSDGRGVISKSDLGTKVETTILEVGGFYSILIKEV